MATGVKKVSEAITKDGRALIMTNTFGVRWEFIPDGTLKIDPDTGKMAVKVKYADDWINVPDPYLPRVGETSTETFDMQNNSVTKIIKNGNKTVRTINTVFMNNKIEETIIGNGLNIKIITTFNPDGSNSIKEEVIKIV